VSSEGISVVNLSSNKEESLPDITRDEEFALRIFDELNRELLGPPNNGNVSSSVTLMKKGRHARRSPSTPNLLHLLL
jgi:hypothetical protein